MTYEIPVIKTQNPKPRPADESKLGFAKYFMDHMFVMEYDEGKVGTIAQRLYDKLYGMQTGVVEDDMGWTYPLGF